MNLLQLPKCLFGSHVRDAKKVTRDDNSGSFVSVCAGCGVPMWRYMDGWSTTKRGYVEIATTRPGDPTSGNVTGQFSANDDRSVNSSR